MASARRDGSIDRRAVEELAQLKELFELQRQLTPHRLTLAPVGLVLITGLMVLISGVIKVDDPEAHVRVQVGKVDLTLGAAETATTHLFGEKIGWATTTRWQNADVPGEASALVKTPKAGSRFLRVSGSADKYDPTFVGIGDATSIEAGLAVSYEHAEHGLNFLSNSSMALPITVMQGNLHAKVADVPDVLSYPLSDSIRVVTDELYFSPATPIGPLKVAAIGFDYHDLVDEGEVALSAIRSAVIEFPEAPNARVQLTGGQSLKLTPVREGVVVQLSRSGNALDVMIAGRFAALTSSGVDVRPSWLNVFAGSPGLQLLFASFSGLLVVLLAVARWMGFRV